MFKSPTTATKTDREKTHCYLVITSPRNTPTLNLKSISERIGELLPRVEWRLDQGFPIFDTQKAAVEHAKEKLNLNKFEPGKAAILEFNGKLDLIKSAILKGQASQYLSRVVDLCKLLPNYTPNGKDDLEVIIAEKNSGDCKLN